MSPTDVDLAAATEFLNARFGTVDAAAYVGEGAWSRCFGFVHEGRDLVVRFGRHLDDFEKDRAASAWRSAALPLPEMLDIGEAFDGYFAISTRAYGVPLESLDADGWRTVTPSLLRALDALRVVPVEQSPPFGAVDYGRFDSWRDYLLSAAVDSPRLRTHGWSERLRESAPGSDAFARGLARLDHLTQDLTIAPSIVHSDLVNRNALVDNDRVTGIFDWGCAFAGDFLYEIAIIVFWTPWYEALGGFDLLGAALAHYQGVGADLHDLDRRLESCAVHIGLTHIAYNAFIRDWPMLDLTANRMKEYMNGTRPTS